MRKKFLTLIIIAFVFTSQTYSQIYLNILQGEKHIYSGGDEIKLQILLKSRPETCVDGMKQAKIFVAGFIVQSQTEWYQQSNSVFWIKHMQLRFVPNSKKKSKITILRKVDKESLFKQVEFSTE